jgi:large subunit ribosomal protein L28
MSRKCEICGKHTMFGNNVSHAKNRTRRTWVLTMRTKKENGSVVRIKLCTKCLKANKAVKVC